MVPQTTNNHMGVGSSYQCVDAIPVGSHAQLFTTSDYVFQGATRWIHGWRRRNWQKDGNPVANADLWQELDRLSANTKLPGSMRKVNHQGLDEAGKLAADAVALERAA